MVDWDAVAYVENSQYRVTTVQALLNKPQIPSEIAKDSEFDMPHVSRAITELAEKDITKLLVDEDTKKGRLYGLTSDGQEVAEAVAERENDG